jgi:sugar phosphate isomerase/epimerase
MPAREVGACSWSLRARSPAELAHAARDAGVRSVQLALTPYADDPRKLEQAVAVLARGGIAVRSGMLSTIGEDYSTLESIRRTGGLRPDEHWKANLARARAVAGLAKRLGVTLVSFHAGFLPENRVSAERRSMIARLRDVVDAFAVEGARVALETGQERAEVLLEVLDDLERPSCGVNFDPANMILYGMGDPVAALALLAPRVLQIHVKDAKKTLAPGSWGEEVPVGSGEVDWPAFFDVVRERRIDVDLMIERESGDDRVGDIQAARGLVERELARIGAGA